MKPPEVEFRPVGKAMCANRFQKGNSPIGKWASVNPTMSNPEMPEDVRRQALMAAQGAKDAIKQESLPAAGTSMTDVERGPATLPGEIPGYGRNFNPVAQPVTSPSPTQKPSGPGRKSDKTACAKPHKSLYSSVG